MYWMRFVRCRFSMVMCKWGSNGPEMNTGYVRSGKPPGLLAPDDLPELPFKIAGEFPARSRLNNLEFARLFAMLGADIPGLLEKITTRWTSKTSPSDDLHYLFCMVQLPGKRSEAVTRATASAFANLHRKMKQRGWHESRNWPLRVAEAFAALSKKDPNLPAALVDDFAFRLPEHAFVCSADERRVEAQGLAEDHRQ